MDSHMHRGQDSSRQMGTAIAQVREGMRVYDARNEHIGEVDEVHFGAASPSQQEHGTGPATTMPADNAVGNPLAEAIADLFDPREVPEELAERLIHNGYIRVDSAGLFAADRYILPDQIASVSDNGVHLRVARDDLIKRR